MAGWPSTQAIRSRTYLIIFLLVIITAFSSFHHSNLRLQITASRTTPNGAGANVVLSNDTEPESGFTIVTPTYKRPERLPTFLDNYATGNIPSLHLIVLQWVDVDSDPPDSILSILPKCPVPIIIEHMNDTSLNLRLNPSGHIKTEAVLSIDDDLEFASSDLEIGLQIWKTWGDSRQRMVGFFPREISEDGIYIVPHVSTYSMVLTKTAFFHRDLMAEYWSSDPKMVEARAYVDAARNCEDILMSFIHAHYTRVPPIYVDVPSKDIGTGGISHSPSHLPQQTACVRKFKELFGNDSLVDTNILVKPYENVSRHYHHRARSASY